LTQPGLTKKVVEALGLCSKNPTAVSTPAEKAPLHHDVGGVPHDGPVNYASVVEMLLYITGQSRPDCAFAVHQCARYTFEPKRSHVVALKRLGPWKELWIKASSSILRRTCASTGTPMSTPLAYGDSTTSRIRIALGAEQGMSSPSLAVPPSGDPPSKLKLRFQQWRRSQLSHTPIREEVESAQLR
ncbi:hypothetical protein ACHAWF_017943, partial [Thalassiosira exigua]